MTPWSRETSPSPSASVARLQRRRGELSGLAEVPQRPRESGRPRMLRGVRARRLMTSRHCLFLVCVMRKESRLFVERKFSN